MIRRPPIQDEEDNPERWLVSYADFITLLFAFFVVMYAISSVNISKYEAVTHAVGGAFKGKSVKEAESMMRMHQGSSIIKPLPLSYLYQKRSKREQEKMAKVGEMLANQLAPQIHGGKLKVLQTHRGIRIDINNSLLFASGEATLSDASRPILLAIANVIKRNKRLVQVEGHTDDTPIHNAAFFSNWELSATRAATVVRMMISDGVDEHRLSAVGYSNTMPIVADDTDVARAQNRRVSIMVLYEEKAAQQAEETVIQPAAKDGTI